MLKGLICFLAHIKPPFLQQPLSSHVPMPSRSFSRVRFAIGSRTRPAFEELVGPLVVQQSYLPAARWPVPSHAGSTSLPRSCPWNGNHVVLDDAYPQQIFRAFLAGTSGAGGDPRRRGSTRHFLGNSEATMVGHRLRQLFGKRPLFPLSPFRRNNPSDRPYLICPRDMTTYIAEPSEEAVRVLI